MRALISVHDKTGVEELARVLTELRAEVVASDGTAAYLSEFGLEATRVEELTDVPELLGGRVKTLHPRIHAAILARGDRVADREELREQGIEPFDLVCVNLYPFRSVVARQAVHEDEALEMIDIGGPAMLRAAAKNFAHVVPLCRPDQYSAVLEQLRVTADVPLEMRRRLAGEAFAYTAAYEAAIAAWFGDRETFPQALIPAFEKVLDLAYGENPHQRAAYYAEAGARRHLLSRVDQLQGERPSFNNLADLSAARALLAEFTVPACVIVKHGNPCGVAVARSPEEAYASAHGSDPVSAYGGVVALNRPVGAAVAAALAEQFVTVVFAPGFDEEAAAVLRGKPATRVFADSERRHGTRGERDYRRVLGGLLVQDRDADVADREGMRVICGRPSESDWGDLLFAWRVCKHVTSNAIVLAKGLRAIGIGAGQMSRVDAVRIALEKAREHGHDVAGAALASDACFPCPDGPRLALDAGVTALIQPGGSRRDADVVAAVEAAGAAMIFTGRRHFRH